MVNIEITCKLSVTDGNVRITHQKVAYEDNDKELDDTFKFFIPAGVFGKDAEDCCHELPRWIRQRFAIEYRLAMKKSWGVAGPDEKVED